MSEALPCQFARTGTGDLHEFSACPGGDYSLADIGGEGLGSVFQVFTLALVGAWVADVGAVWVCGVACRAAGGGAFSLAIFAECGSVHGF
jgi:hypothetical protein